MTSQHMKLQTSSTSLLLHEYAGRRDIALCEHNDASQHSDKLVAIVTREMGHGARGQ